MCRAAMIAACACALLLAANVDVARAERSRRQPVSIDWSTVNDDDIARCGLSRLRAGIIERLVEDGHALVGDVGDGEEVPADLVQVVVASSGGSLLLRVRGGGHSREEAVALGPDCDSTAALEVITRVSELVRQVAPAAAALVVDPPATGPRDRLAPAGEPARESSPARSALNVSLDACARANPAPGLLLLGGGFSVRARLGEAWESGGRLELTGNGHAGVTVLEGSLLWTAAYQPALPGVGLHLEVGPLLHSGSSDALSALELDATLGTGVQLELGHLLAQLVLYARLRGFEHRVGDEIAFETGRFGLILRIGAQLFGS